MKDKVKPEVLKQIDWEAWYHKPGMPPVPPRFDETLYKAARDLAANLVDGKV